MLLDLIPQWKLMIAYLNQSHSATLATKANPYLVDNIYFYGNDIH